MAPILIAVGLGVAVLGVILGEKKPEESTPAPTGRRVKPKADEPPAGGDGNAS